MELTQMKRCGLVFLLLGPLSWGQATNSKSAMTGTEQPPTPAPVVSGATGQESIHEAAGSNVTADKPVITIAGICDRPAAGTGVDSDCRTVISRSQFQQVIDAVQPGMPPRARREFALRYAEALAMTNKAEQMGLDKGAIYEEQMKIARIQVLSQAMKKVIQERASQISDQEINDYYANNATRFEKAEMDRIYVPRSRQLLSVSENHLRDDRQAGPQEPGQAMKKEAENLRARAVAGEDFAKLQADAYQVAGIRSMPPNTTMEVRRTSLPPNHAFVMDLKPGEISAVLADPNGYFIYRLKAREVLPPGQVREEIKATLRSQRMQTEMRAIQDSAVPALDESYFGR